MYLKVRVSGGIGSRRSPHSPTKGEDLKECVMRFNCETVLVPNLQYWIAYIALLNGLLPRRPQRHMLGIALSNKILKREEERRRALSWISVQGKMRKRLGISTPALRAFSWRSRQPESIKTPAKFRNENKYCGYHEDLGTPSPNELANLRQLNAFLMSSNKEDCNHRNPKGKRDNDAGCSMEIIAIIIGGIDDK
ncbi:hypothetical protein Cgig2_025014 [Carnegiea gigantea]|uniref:Uncharacterized protein n=1 Tax=Carnegiea gigantea TaxID=171969 RepID=A0A9Q1GKC6_9CARY|nr:hypothetical protein Cgig2_025014 [Carnegiea gigantea]